MFSHKDVWHGIDRLAKHHGLTASGLARRAGLDPTTFNPSKRTTKQSKPRWPSTESIAKILTATDTEFADFLAFMFDQPLGQTRTGAPRLRCLALDQVEREGLFDESGFPIGEAWDEIDLPVIDDRYGYALEVRGGELEPAYRDGDFLIVSPTANIRRRDRVIAKRRSGPVLVGVLLRRTAQRVEIGPLDGARSSTTFETRDLDWLARIVWASQ